MAGKVIETVYTHPCDGGEDPAILARLTEMIDRTPAGASIHATIFRLTVESVRDALVAANNRGVVVRVIHNGRDVANAVAASLSREEPLGLGARHRWSGQPYEPAGLRPDFGAVATGRNSDLHTKLFLFSATHDPDGVLRKNVCWWSSANLSHHSGMQKSNNAIVFYDDRTLYERFRTQLWELMWNGTHFARNDFYNGNRATGTFLGAPADRTKVFCSPERETDLWVGRLASVVADASTQVHVAHARFTDSRTAVADELVRINRQGGAVRVLVGADPDFLGPTVRRTLLGAGIPVRTANIHDKLVLVHSRYGVSARPRKVVFSGSHNLNHDANYVNDEILVKTFDDTLYDDLLAAHVDWLWSSGSPLELAPAADSGPGDAGSADSPSSPGVSGAHEGMSFPPPPGG
jgi:phosphatidylserine/phosphatidylglycerophosphate/cardiolipin synthase-like enzyme